MNTRSHAGALIAYLFLNISSFGFDIPKDQRQTHGEPTLKTIQQIQSDFLQLAQPLEFSVSKKSAMPAVTFMNSPSGMPYSIRLRGEVERFSNAYHPADIALALVPYLKDESHDAEAFIVLTGLLRLPCAKEEITFKSRAQPGDWPTSGKTAVELTASVANSFISEWSKIDIYSPHLKMLRTYRILPSEILPSSLKKSR